MTVLARAGKDYDWRLRQALRREDSCKHSSDQDEESRLVINFLNLPCACYNIRYVRGLTGAIHEPGSIKLHANESIPYI